MTKKTLLFFALLCAVAQGAWAQNSWEAVYAMTNTNSGNWCCLDGEPFIQETFHMTKSLAIRFWESFAPAYFGKDKPLAEIEAMIRPYAGLKTLIIERDTQRPMPEFREALRDVLE